MDTTTPQCPICKTPVKRAAENGWFPFCSNRCKLVDLSHWLNAEYRIPAADDEEEPVPSRPDGQVLH